MYTIVAGVLLVIAQSLWQSLLIAARSLLIFETEFVATSAKTKVITMGASKWESANGLWSVTT